MPHNQVFFSPFFSGRSLAAFDTITRMSATGHKLQKDALSIMENVYNHEGAYIIEEALLGLASVNVAAALAPEAPVLAQRLREAAARCDFEEREMVLSSLYRVLHSAGSLYSPEEQEAMRKIHGIPKQPGGITPILLSLPFIRPESTVVDLGAGNGLQGLLMQKLAPHERTVMIEISANMIEAGKVMESGLGLEAGRVVWSHADLIEADLEDLAGGAPDLLYMYRPIKPVGEGRGFYKRIAEWIETWPGGSAIMSVADCMGSFLGSGIDKLYEDEFMTVFRKA